ncbi:hypothetical protein [Halorientalis marina]|uniref:hypothetical protein n=1 Tax=Halorientalis marina TaxID=2931976 RepID=UPI001FF58D16|nr:hypothetical protein [Halorientalis marina]
MGDWNVEADTEKGRLYIELSGYIEGEEAERSTNAVVEAAEKMDEGFDVITDIADVQPGDAEAVENIKRGKEAVAENGATAAVRITPESTTGQMQFERAGDEPYAVAMADSVEKAEKLLDQRRAEQ